MDVKQLEAFVAVSRYKSFSKAARELFLTQPTISSHIQNLEKELDTVLFNRNNKCITLTKSGEILLENAVSILNSCKKAIYDIKEYSGKIEGIIDIVSSSIPEAYILPKFIKSFSNKYPDVKFNISHHDSQYAISEILNDRISFGFVGSKTSNSQIKYIDLISDELVLITPVDLNIENDNGYIELNQLSKLKFIMRKEGSGTRNLTFNVLNEHNFNINNLNILAYVESNETIKEMVKIGLGVSFVSYKSAKDYIDTNKLNFYKIKNVNFTRSFYFIYSKKKAFSPLENKFLNSLCEYFNI